MNPLSGDDWECHVQNEGRSSSAADDDENVYGVNNLSYLKEQVKGYGTTEGMTTDEGSLEQQDNYDEDDAHDGYMKVDNGNLLVTMSHNGTLSFQENANSNASANELESSGDGELPVDNENAGNNLESKTDYIPIPMSDKLVASQLQRLTQLIKNVKNNQNDPSAPEDLTPSDLNAFLALHKLKVNEFHSNKNAVPLPQNKLIDEHHLHQILDLQKKLNALANHHDAYSTQRPPVKFHVANGHYPVEATTVHINTVNSLKHPRFPNVGASTSQIVVNRPGGTVVFRLPYSSQPSTTTASAEQRPSNEKSENHINTETLKMILELSKYMSNQAPNTPQFVHSLPTKNSYLQSTSASHQTQFTIPWEQLNANSLAVLMNLLQKQKLAQEDSSSMEKMASVSGSVPFAGYTASEPDDVGPTTIIHNHIPIHVANPRPTGPIITRDQLVPTTTMRPIPNDRYDNFGDDVHDRPASAHASHNYYSYPNIPEKMQQLSAVVGSVATPQPQQHHQHYQQQQHYHSPQRPSNHHESNEYDDQPNYVQIAHSKPSHFDPQYTDPTAFAASHAIRPTTPTFVSVNGGYTKKIFSPYTPQPHLSDDNVNDFVSIDEKPYPTFTPTANYVPISMASSPKPIYSNAPDSFKRKKKRPKVPQHVYDKVATFESAKEPSENDEYEDVDENENENDERHNYGIDDGNDDDDGDSSNGFNHWADPNLDRFDSDENGENVMNLLAIYKSDQLPATAKIVPFQPTAATKIEFAGAPPTVEQQRHDSSSALNHKQLVSLNGNVMSLSTYQQTIEPFLKKDSQPNLQIEVMTCATGVRQANQTDCTRYFVCNEKSGKILSYTCPPYTAFNGDIKLCTGEMYAKCVGNAGTTENNALLTPQKVQQLAQLIEMQREKILNSAQQVKQNQQMQGGGAKATLPAPVTSTPATIQTHKTHVAAQKPTTKTRRKQSQSNASKKQQRPLAQSTHLTNNAANVKQGKRKIPCKKEGKMIDDRSTRHYFLCYRDQTKAMRARRLECPAKLAFCPSTLVCTDRCSK